MCGQKVIGACWVGNIRTCRWTPKVKEGVKLKREAFWVWLAGVYAETADRYHFARRAVTEGLRKLEEFNKAMEMNFQMISDFR